MFCPFRKFHRRLVCVYVYIYIIQLIRNQIHRARTRRSWYWSKIVFVMTWYKLLGILYYTRINFDLFRRRTYLHVHDTHTRPSDTATPCPSVVYRVNGTFEKAVGRLYTSFLRPRRRFITFIKCRSNATENDFINRTEHFEWFWFVITSSFKIYLFRRFGVRDLCSPPFRFSQSFCRFVTETYVFIFCESLKYVWKWIHFMSRKNRFCNSMFYN